MGILIIDNPKPATTPMKFGKPDGTIEFGTSGCCCPPGQRGRGQHTNSRTSWWRINEGPWHRIMHSTSSARTLAQAAETCVEFADAMFATGEVR